MLSPDQLLAQRYRIVKLLGQGGMGAVYHAYDTVLDRPVAVKQLQPNPLPGAEIPEQARAQFKREAQILASLSHPNLPRVTDYFVDQGFQYLVMDYIAGKSLDELVLEHGGGLDEGQVLDWADQLLLALEYIHQHGIIHRDVKPSNVRLTPDGRIFLVDFGLFKALNPNDPHTISVMRGLGTPQYAPPEQYDSGLGHTDARSDIYSLGATLYHLLAGRAPATVTQRMSDPGAFQSARERGAKISLEVDHVILRAMEVQRANRFAAAADMRTALRLARSSPPEPGTTNRLAAKEPQPISRHSRSRFIVPALIGATAIIVIAGLVSVTQPSTPTPNATPTATLKADVRITTLSGITIPEFVVVQNHGNLTQTMTGWTLTSAVGTQTFNFPAGFELLPGASVKIESYNGAANHPPASLLWTTDPIWRNAGDKAILYDDHGQAVNDMCYGNSCP